MYIFFSCDYENSNLKVAERETKWFQIRLHES